MAIAGTMDDPRSRTLLRAALRSGDPIAITRAWERVRVNAQAIGREERVAARSARRAVGRAIRDARMRRIEAATVGLAVTPSAPAAQAARRLPWRLAIAIFLVATLILLLLLIPRDSGGGGSPQALAQEEVPEVLVSAIQVPTGGRGRTTATQTPVVAVQVVDPPSPTVAPSVAPSASAPPAPAVTGVPGGVPGGTGTGGSGGGSGGGNGPGAGSSNGPGSAPASATPRPTPAASPSGQPLPAGPPPSPAPGQGGFRIRVLDRSTLQPLSDVCVAVGTTCSQADYRTNGDGWWWLYLEPSAAPNWSFRFLLDGYLVSTYPGRYSPGRITNATIYLTKSR